MNILTQKKLLSYINDNINPTIKLKKSKGEVFTPLSVINKILSKLPDDVWTNPNLRWLDPCTGIGNYPIIIYYKLMDGLSDWEPDEETLEALRDSLAELEDNLEGVSLAAE